MVKRPVWASRAPSDKITNGLVARNLTLASAADDRPKLRPHIAEAFVIRVGPDLAVSPFRISLGTTPRLIATLPQVL